jgi:hypothetical protein
MIIGGCRHIYRKTTMHEELYATLKEARIFCDEFKRASIKFSSSYSVSYNFALERKCIRISGSS